MSGLPPALAPWAEPLAPFAPDLALILGEWARRLAPAVGAIPRRRGAPGEPDGLSGLARRGPYERLLLTEWLLADELPDEFLRRAAAHEHLFLAPGRRGGSAGLRSVALLDAGPEQLGAPRIAQLAVLVVLASRAQAAGAELRWGVVQDPEAGLASGFSAELARRFLGARTRTAADGAALGAWVERIAGAGPHDDAWLVGGPGLPASPALAGASRLCIEEVPDPALRQVRLTLAAHGVRRREVLLDLPAPADCVRLVRDPFRAAQVEPRRMAGTPARSAPPRFSDNGRRMALRLEGAELLELPVPNSARVTPGRSRTTRGGPGLIAVGWRRKRLVSAEVVAGEVVVGAHGQGAAGRCRPGHGVPMPSGPRPSEPPGLLHFAVGQVWLLDGAGVLYHGPHADGPRDWSAELWIASVDVSATLADRDRLLYVARGPKGALELVAHTAAGREALSLGTGAGRSYLAHDAGQLMLAVEEERGGTWRVWRGARADLRGPHSSRVLRPPSDTEVVGLVGVSAARGLEPALLLLESDRRDFTLLSAAGLRLAFGAAGPVAAAAVSPDGRVIAYTTSAGALHAWSLPRGQQVLHLLPGGAR